MFLVITIWRTRTVCRIPQSVKIRGEEKLLNGVNKSAGTRIVEIGEDWRGLRMTHLEVLFLKLKTFREWHIKIQFEWALWTFEDANKNVLSEWSILMRKWRFAYVKVWSFIIIVVVVVVIIVIIPDHYHYHEILIPFIIIRSLKSYLPTTDFIYVKETSYLQTIVVCALVFTRAAQECAW